MLGYQMREMKIQENHPNKEEDRTNNGCGSDYNSAPER
jgi:hypothetical protein